jgi:hypothetical protein
VGNPGVRCHDLTDRTAPSSAGTLFSVRAGRACRSTHAQSGRAACPGRPHW